MGFFDNLFKKKECSICGGEIGLLGNRKLEDGNCCKICAKKLSPWFEERRHSTVEQIKDQLSYREENQNKLENFHVSTIIGDFYKMYIEEVNGVPTRFFVYYGDDYISGNPDIIQFKDLLSCTTDIRTYKEELKTDDGNGNKVSYNPPRYKTKYNFWMNMTVGNNPYFDDISFQINSRTVTLETGAGTEINILGMTIGGGPAFVGDPAEMNRYDKYSGMCQQIEDAVQRSREQVPFATPKQEEKVVASAASAVQEETAKQAKPQTWECNSCGAINNSKFCESCGTPKP